MPGRKPNKKKVAPIRGTKIRFVRGSYQGEKGWLNSAKEHTDHYAYVIVDGGQRPEEDADFATSVKKTSFFEDLGDNGHPEEYVIQEDPKVASHLAGLAVALAEAGIEETTELLLLIITHAVDTACQIQMQKGKKAKYSASALVVKNMLAERKRKSRSTASRPMEEEEEE